MDRSMYVRATWLLGALACLLRSASAECVPSNAFPGLCEIEGAAGVQVHYALHRDSVSFAVKAPTDGYVALSFAPTGQEAMFPADAVVGWVGTTTSVRAYQLNGYLPIDVTDSGVTLTNTSAYEEFGFTTIRFTRPLRAGRFFIDPKDVTMNVAYGDKDGLTQHDPEHAGIIRADLLTGTPKADPPSSGSSVSAATALLLGVVAAAVL